MSHACQAMSVSLSEGGVAELVFTEGARGNPIDQAFCDDLNAVSVDLSADPRVRAVLLRAEGKAFSFGGDLAVFHANLEHLPRLILEMTAALHPAVARLQRPGAGGLERGCARGRHRLLGQAQAALCRSLV
jgi:enoyl-CoA hydratase/carnithine racemase